MSVVLEKDTHTHVLICKGAVEEILTASTSVDEHGTILPLSDARRDEALRLARELNEDGLRVVAVPYKELTSHAHTFTTLPEKIVDGSDRLRYRT
jgi:Mg2+-importing ATPase